MAVELATAYVTLTTSARGIGESVRRELRPISGVAKEVGDKSGKDIGSGIQSGSKTAAGGFKSAMKEVAGVTAGIFAIGEIKDFFTEAFDAARESVKVNALSAAAIKSTGAAAGVTAAEVAELGTKISEYSGIDHLAIQAGENLILTFANIKNRAGEGNDIFDQTTIAATNMSVALGGSVSSEALKLGKALNDPVKGAVALRRAGIQLSAQQTAQVAAFTKSGNILGAQKVILGEVSKKYGDAARAAASPTAKLTVAWEDFKEKVGIAALPVINKFATFMTGHLVPALSATFGWLDRNSHVIGPFVAIIASLTAAWLIYSGAVKVAAAAQELFDAAMALSGFGQIIILIALVVAGFVLMYTHVSWFREGVQAAFAWIKKAAVDVFDWVKTNWPLLLAILTGPIGLAVLAIVRHWDTIKAAVTGVKNWIVARWNDIVGFIAAIPGRIASIAVHLWDSLKTGAQTAYTAVTNQLGRIVSWVTSIPGKISKALHSMFDPLLDAGKTVFNAIARAWNATVGSVSLSVPAWVPGFGGDTFTFPRMGQFARGGMLPPGWSIVGENGAELVHKAGSSVQVFSNADSAGMTQGSAGQVSIGRLVEFSGPVTVRSDQDILELSRNIARETNRRLRGLGVGVTLSGAMP